MSTCYSLVCDDCKTKMDAGQSGGDTGRYFYCLEDIQTFLFEHLSHRVRLLVSEDLPLEILEDYTLHSSDEVQVETKKVVVLRRIDINTIRPNPNAGKTVMFTPGRKIVELNPGKGITIRQEALEIRTICPAPDYLFEYEELVIKCRYCGSTFSVDELEDDWDGEGFISENGCPWCHQFSCCEKIEVERIEDALKRKTNDK